MKFEEKNGTYLSAEGMRKNIVYFLLDGDEVVYIGQSRHGISRMYAHIDKEFTGCFYIEIKDDRVLDYAEMHYITKYRPKYNKTVYSIVPLKRIRDYMRNRYKEKYGCEGWSRLDWYNFQKDFSVPSVKKILKEYNIPIVKEGKLTGITNHAMAWFIQNYEG